MIVEALVRLVTGLLRGVLALIPPWTPPDLSGLGAQFAAKLRMLDGYVPVSVLGACLAALFGLRAVIVVWGLLVWVYEHLPFKSS